MGEKGGIWWPLQCEKLFSIQITFYIFDFPLSFPFLCLLHWLFVKGETQSMHEAVQEKFWPGWQGQHLSYKHLVKDDLGTYKYGQGVNLLGKNFPDHFHVHLFPQPVPGIWLLGEQHRELQTESANKFLCWLNFHKTIINEINEIKRRRTTNSVIII